MRSDFSLKNDNEIRLKKTSNFRHDFSLDVVKASSTQPSQGRNIQNV